MSRFMTRAENALYLFGVARDNHCFSFSKSPFLSSNQAIKKRKLSLKKMAGNIVIHDRALLRRKGCYS